MSLVYKPFSSINYAFKHSPSPRDQPRSNLSSISRELMDAFPKPDAQQSATQLTITESFEAC